MTGASFLVWEGMMVTLAQGCLWCYLVRILQNMLHSHMVFLVLVFLKVLQIWIKYY